MSSHEVFGSRLKNHRERLGVSLQSIAAQTKISRWMLEALERGDLSRLPGGIYRRALLRQYARAVRLPAEPLIDEALRLTSEAGGPAPATDGLRLTLVPEPRWPARARQCLAAALDTGAILLAGYGLTAFSGLGFWPATTCAAASYYAAGTIVLGQSLSAWALSVSGLWQTGRRPATFLDRLAALRHDWLRADRQEAQEEAVAFGRSLR